MSSSPPKVLHFHFGKDGGAERFFVSLAQVFGERGVEQRFVIRPGRTWRGELEGLGSIVENHYRRISLSSLLLERRVRRTVREWRPDAIMAWMPRAARLIPDWPDAVKLARLGDFPAHLKHFGRCDLLVGNLPGIGDRCRTLGWAGPVRTISNFPPETAPRPVKRADLDTPDDAFLVAGAGRFVPRKGFDLLVRAAAALPDAWLWLIGDGQQRGALEALAREAGIAERTRFTGWVPEPMHYIAATDVFAMPSRHEPLGNVVLEAWRAGVPVVSTRSEGPSWYMIDERNGLLANIDDVDGLSSALGRLRSRPDLAASLVAGGRETLEDAFSRERIVDRYLDLFARRPAGGDSG